LPGTYAEDFALQTLYGDPFRLADLRGKVIVLDFWATWCQPCRVELPVLEKLRAEFAESARFYGVDAEDPTAVKAFVASNRYEMPVLVDSGREVNHRYGVSGIPTLFVIDRDGVIRQRLLGTRSEEALRAAIQSVVEGRAEAPGPRPLIASVTAILPQPGQTIAIRGSGFGTHPPYQNQDTAYLAIRDKTAHWAAGRATAENWDAVSLNVARWTDSEILVTGLAGSYGANGWKLNPGDEIEVAVWNPETGVGPSTYTLFVAQHLPVQAPRVHVFMPRCGWDGR
jgi:thiol-disulfide isomerase/thioredoxin